MDISDKKVHFLGDSITEGVGASAPENCYVGLFRCKYPNAEITNYGVGGTRIAKQSTPSVYEDWDFDFNRRVEKMTEGADLVVVFGGTNDYGHGDAPFGAWGDIEETTFCGAVYSLYEKLLRKYPFAKFLVLTPLHRLGENQPGHTGKTLREYVEIVKRTAELFSFPVLDLWSVSGINPAMAKVKETMMPDGLHPNDCGYVRLFELIDAYIKNML